MRNITELVPKKSTFKLKMVDKTFSLRPCTLGEMFELNQRFTDVEKMLAYPHLINVSKIALALMDKKDVKYFGKREVEAFDVETGETTTEKLGGYKLFIKLVSNMEEHMNIYGALLECFGHEEEFIKKTVKVFKDSVNKVADNLINGNDEVKKKIA